MVPGHGAVAMRLDPGNFFNIYYDTNVVGTFEADLVVDQRVIVELKAKEKLVPAHEAQLTSYLRAMDVEIGQLFNFGKAAEFKRKLFENRYKRHTGLHSHDDLLRSLLEARSDKFKSDPF